MPHQSSLPQSLLDQLVQSPPHVQHSQLSPDQWQLVWYETPGRLRYLFAGEPSSTPLRCHCHSNVARTIIHFRQQINVERGIIDILLESVHNLTRDITLQALVGFFPHTAQPPVPDPAMSVTAQWGNFQQTVPVVDGMATFPTVTCDDLGCVSQENTPPLSLTLSSTAI